MKNFNINNLELRFIGYGHYVITYTQSVTTTDMELVDKIKLLKNQERQGTPEEIEEAEIYVNEMLDRIFE